MCVFECANFCTKSASLWSNFRAVSARANYEGPEVTQRLRSTGEDQHNERESGPLNKIIENC